MANPANQLNQNNPVDKMNKGFENVKDRVRDASSDLENKLPGQLSEKMNEYTEQGRKILSDVRDRAGELYEVSSDWVQENRLITTLSLAAIAGVIGFFVGRSRKEI